jgi:hypothetical protein
LAVKYNILLISILILSLSNKKVTNKYFVELEPQSSLTIQGITNVNTFELSYLIKSPAVSLYPSVNVTDSSYNLGIADLHIPLRQFETGNHLLKNDFLELVKEKQFPVMTVSAKSFYLIGKKLPGFFEMQKGIAGIAITLGGITRTYNITFTLKGNNQTFLIEGHQTFNIRDFNLEPPTKFFGLVHVKETIEIAFNLNVRFSRLD